MQISRIRLSDKASRLRPRRAAPTLGQTYEPEVPVEVREWKETLVLPVKLQAIPLALPLRRHFATPEVAPVSVSRRPREVTASPLPQTVLVSPPLVLVAR